MTRFTRNRSDNRKPLKRKYNLDSTIERLKYAEDEGKLISNLKGDDKEKAYNQALDNLSIKPKTYEIKSTNEKKWGSNDKNARDYIPKVNQSTKNIENPFDALGFLSQQSIYGLSNAATNILGGAAKTVGNLGTSIDSVLDIPESIDNSWRKGLNKTLMKQNPDFYDNLSNKQQKTIDDLNNQIDTQNILEKNINAYSGIKEGLDNLPFSNAFNEIGDSYLNASDLNKTNYNQDKMSKPLKFAGDILYGVSNMAPSIAAGVATGNPNVALGVMGANSYGGGIKQALDNDASLETAVRFGLANAATEIITEKLVGGIPALGAGYTDDFVKELTDKMFSNPKTRSIIEKGFDIVGEGFEEYLSEIIGEFATDIYSNEKQDIDNFERLKNIQGDALYSGLVGAATAGVLNAPSYISEATNNTNINEVKLDNELNALSNEELDGIQSEIEANSNENILNEELHQEPQIDVIEPLNNQINESVFNEPQIDNNNLDIDPQQKLVTKETLLSDDANISLNAQKLNKENIEIISKETNWDKNNVQLLSDFSNKSGIIIKTENLPSSINGMFVNGEIVLNKNTENPVLIVFTHELTHSLESKTGYNDLKTAVIRDLKSNMKMLDSDIDSIIQEDLADIIETRFDYDGYQMTNDEAMNELVAQYIETNIDSESFIKEISGNKPLLQKIVDWLDDMIKSFIGTEQEKAYINLKNKYKNVLNSKNIKFDGNSSYTTIPEYSIIDTIKKLSPNAIDRNGNVIPYKTQLNDVLHKWRTSGIKVSEASNRLIISKDTTNLSYANLNNSVLTISKNVLGKVLFGKHKGTIPKSVIENIHTYLDQSVLAFDGIGKNLNKKGFILGVNDSNNNPILVSIVQEITKDRINYNVNDIVTIHGRKNLQNTINSASHIYLNKKSSGYLTSLRLQLPTGVRTTTNYSIAKNKLMSSTDGIASRNSNVNNITLNKMIPDLINKVNNSTLRIMNAESNDMNKLLKEASKDILNIGDISAEIKSDIKNLAMNNAGYNSLNIDVNPNYSNKLLKDLYSEDVYSQILDEELKYFKNEINSSIKNRDNILEKSKFNETKSLLNDNMVTEAFRAMNAKAYSDEIVPAIEKGDYLEPSDYFSNKSVMQEKANSEEVQTNILDIVLGGLDKGALSKSIEQNGDAIANGSDEVKEAWKNVITKPLFESKAKYSKEIVTRLDDVYNVLVKDLGIKKGSKESAAIMWYGEGQRIKPGSSKIEIEPYTLNDLKRDFPKNHETIIKGSEYIRTIYDEYINRLNESLELIYPTQKLEKAVKDRQNSKLKEIEAKQNELINSPIDKAASINRTIARLSREYNQAKDFVYRNRRLQPRSDYFMHFQEISMADNLRDLFSLEGPANISNQLAGKSDFTKPLSKWEGFMQRRGMGRYAEDAIGGLVNYIPKAEYKINIDPYTAYMRGVIKNVVDISDDNQINNANMINYLSNFTNDLAGKTNPVDRVITNFQSGRWVVSKLKKLNSKVKANAVMGNMNSAMSQFFNMPNAISLLTKKGGIKSSLDLAKGTKYYFADKLINNDLVKQSPFLTERYMDKHVSQFDEGILDNVKEFAGFLLTFGDEVVAKQTWYSAYAQAQRLGIDNQISYADEITRRAIAGRGVGETALLQKSQLVGLIAPFQVEVNNTWQLMKSLAGGKDEAHLGALMMMFLTTWVMNNINETITGNRVGFDPINAMEDVYNNDEAGFGRLVGELVGNIPFSSQLTMLAITNDYDRENFFGEADPSRYGIGNMGVNALTDPLISLIKGEDIDLIKLGTQFGVPYGGKQLERMYNYGKDVGLFPGITFNKGVKIQKPKEGAYNQSGKLKYLIDTDNPFDVAKGWLFGSYSTKEGREYLKTLRPLSESKTELMDMLVDAGADKHDAFNAVKNTYNTNIVTGYDKYGNKITLDNSKAALNRKLFEESGVFDDIMSIINSPENVKKDKKDPSKLKPSDFNMNNKVFEMDEKTYSELLEEIEKYQ